MLPRRSERQRAKGGIGGGERARQGGGGGGVSRSSTLRARVCLPRDRTPVPRQLVALPHELTDRPDGRPNRYHPDEQEPKISPRGFIKPEEYLAQSL